MAQRTDTPSYNALARRRTESRRRALLAPHALRAACEAACLALENHAPLLAAHGTTITHEALRQQCMATLRDALLRLTALDTAQRSS